MGVGEGGASTDEKPLHLQVLALVVFATFNIGLNEFNQWALKKDQWPGFHFPFFYTMFHMLVSALAAYLLQWLVVKPALGPPTFRQLWAYKLGIVPMGICSFLTNGLNNASLTLVSLFLNQAIKACMPMPTMLFSFVCAGKRYSLLKVLVVLAICTGSVMAVWYKVGSGGSTQVTGVIICVCGALACALRPVLAMLLMDGLGGGLPKLEPTVVMAYDTSIAFTCMLITWLCMEERAESITYLSDPATTGVGILIVVAGSAMAFVFNLSNFYFIKLTSALTTAIGGSGIKILLIIISAIQAGVNDPVSWSGVAIVVLSLIWYTYLSVSGSGPADKAQPPPQPSAAPTTGAPGTGAPDPERGAPRSTERTPLVRP